MFVLIVALVLFAADGAGATVGEAADTAAAAQTSSGPPPSTVAQTTPSAPPEKPPGTFGVFLSDNHEAFRTYGLIIGALFGLIFAFWRARIATRQGEAAAARADAAIKQAGAANEQARIAEQGHFTERFSRAVEQLGHDKVAVRIGGLYALRRIAEDSVERDHLAVMDVIINFIRQPPYADAQRVATERERKPRAYKTTTVAALRHAAGGRLPEPELIDCPDVVAATEIILSRTEGQKAIEDARKYRLSLSRANLSYLRLPEIDLHVFALAGANLTGTELTVANFLEAKLERADLGGANLRGADLRGANLRGANLAYTDLGDARLTGADLTGANLTGAQLNHAYLTGAGLWNANLTGADLWDAIITGAKLTNADLTKANLRKANLTKANLAGANLAYADLTRANLMRASLTGVDLTVAKNLTQQQLDGIRYNPEHPPTLPPGFVLPEPPPEPEATSVEPPPPEDL
jgi:uncharacterized protein YjbI with pentapeptide repeats